MKILPDSGYDIGPHDIDTSVLFVGAFGSFDSEETARAIVRYCQHQDCWSPFTLDDLGRFFGKRGTDGWMAENLRVIAGGAITKGSRELQLALYLESDEEDEMVYYVNERFIDRCHAASPADKKV